MRCFLALDLPEAVADALDRLAARLPVGRAVPPEDMHLTLVFVEQAAPAALEDWHLALEMLAMPPLALAVAGADLFGGDAPRSLHVRVQGGAALTAFQAKVETAARRAGLNLPRRRFVPHITLARFARRLPPEDMARIGRFLAADGDVALPPFVPPALTLYRSTLGPDGPRYDPLARYGAGGAEFPW